MNSLNSPSPDFSPMRDIIYELWNKIKTEMFQWLEIEEKSGTELVTRIDRLIESLARELIKKQFWNVNFLWEEFPDEDNGSDITFIIDPLDGTESFIYREFNTTVSIGVEIWWKLVTWFVYDFMRDILYEGWKESSLYIANTKLPLLRENITNKTRILVSGRWQEVEDIQTTLRKTQNMQVTRSYGSVALQTVLTGAGSYDGYVRVWKVKPWDIAGAIPFIDWLKDTQVYSREWKELDYKNPDSWLIVVRNDLRKELFQILDI